jgi:hypothetical protein
MIIRTIENPVTSLGIKATTFQLVAQLLLLLHSVHELLGPSSDVNCSCHVVTS